MVVSFFLERLNVKPLSVPAWEARQGAEAARVSRGTTVALSRTEKNFTQWIGTSTVHKSPPETANQCVHLEVPTSTLNELARHLLPPHTHTFSRPPSLLHTQPRRHASTMHTHVRQMGSANRQTCSIFMIHRPPERACATNQLSTCVDRH